MTLGMKIQQIRTEHGLSQEDFAEKLGTTRQTVSRWELDQALPEIAKIVLISKVFSVSTDSILKNGISTFDDKKKYFQCGVYRNADCEIAETEKFAIVFYCSSDKNVLGVKLYKGYENKKRLVAICERNKIEEITEYAYFVDGSNPHTAISNSERMAPQLGASYDTDIKSSMRRLETFSVDHSGTPLPTVKKAGIPNCLKLWRMTDKYFANHDRFEFLMSTEKRNIHLPFSRKTSIFIAVRHITSFLISDYSARVSFSEYAIIKTTARRCADFTVIFHMR